MFSSNWWSIKLLHEAATDFGYNMLSGFRTGGRLLDSGLAIMTKYPILEHEFHMYQTHSGIDSLAAKGILYAKVQITNSEVIHCFVTHLNAQYKSPDPETRRTRKEQMDELTNYIDGFVSAGRIEPYDRVIIFGDFNTQDEVEYGVLKDAIDGASIEFSAMSQFLEPTAFQVVGPDGKDKHFIPDMFQREIPDDFTVLPHHMDWMFYRNQHEPWNISIEVIDSKQQGSIYKSLSDHRAVTATFKTSHCHPVTLNTFDQTLS